MITQSPNDKHTTTSLRNIAAHLRHMANVLSNTDCDELVAPVTVEVNILPATWAWGGPPAQDVVDQVGAALGIDVGWLEKPSTIGGYARYGGQISEENQPWKLAFFAYLRAPDPADLVRQENERLKAKLAEIERIAGDQP